jgi:SAM-dependent methyltransferase
MTTTATSRNDRHRAMWALGDYPSVADTVIPNLGARLVDACGVAPGRNVLDVAAGSGNAALPAAARGAEVTALDLTPELLDAGRSAAATRGLTLAWDEGDAEAMPYATASFDVVLSCVGVMFAPDHAAAAAEMARVCRPGGTIGLASWTADGFVGQMLAAVKPYVPPPPAGAQPAPLWGDPAHVAQLFGDAVTDVHATVESVDVDCFATPDEFVACFRERYGPTVAAYRGLAGDPERVAALDRDLAALAERDLCGGHMQWDYLLWTATRQR